jgi:RimJ/RimL family protein N-acetyltransferase
MLVAPAETNTPQLRLRRLRADDLDAFAAMNADPDVMEFFPRPWSFEESRASLEKINSGFDARGFGVYAADFKAEFAGIIGLSVPSFQAWFTPCVEILWRLQPRFWGKGLASEGAGAVLQMAFQTLLLPEVVAFTVATNLRSIRVMERLGMVRDAGAYFDHPAVIEPRLKRHVLYRAKAYAP